MSANFTKFFSAVRDAAEKRWSHGVEVSRCSKIYSAEEQGSDAEIRLVQQSSGQSVHRRITLWPEAEDWACDCGQDTDPCVHVIAAVISYRQVLSEKRELEKLHTNTCQVLYSFSSSSERMLCLQRLIVDTDKRTVPLKSSLAALASGRVAGPKIIPLKEDITVDEVLRNFRGGAIPSSIMPNLLAALSRCHKITFDGQEIKCSGEYVGHIATLSDDGGAVLLTGVLDKRIRKGFRNSAALITGGVLKPLRTALPPKLLKLLAEGRRFGQRELPDLVATLLPKLESMMEVKVLTTRLPGGRRVSPRLAFVSTSDGECLRVTPRIVYGKPPLATLIGDHLDCTGKDVPLRQPNAERDLVNKLARQEGWTVGTEVELQRDAAINFVSKYHNSTDLELIGVDWKDFRLHAPLEPHLDIQREANGVKVTLEFRSDTAKSIDGSKVLQAWERQEPLVALLDGGWAELPKDWLQKFGPTLKNLLAGRDAKQPLPIYRSFEVFKLSDDCGLKLSKPLESLRSELGEELSAVPSALPRDLCASLRNYQEEGVRWLQSMGRYRMGCLLADDMGLGKTLQSICVLAKRSLVVAPTSVLYNWQAEISKFRPKLTVCIYHGGKRQFSHSSDVVLTSYALLRRDLELFIAETWQVCVLDEAQAIKNPRSKIAHAAYRIDAFSRIALTGTPLENHLEDIWSQFNFLNPGLLGTNKDFNERFVKPIGDADPQVLKQLRGRLAPFMLRRIKASVAQDLPSRLENILYCELSAAERHIYDSLLHATREQVIASLAQKASTIEILELLLRLRQAACHPRLLPGQSLTDSAKVVRLLSLLGECSEDDHKALVFSQWTAFLDLIALELDRLGICYGRIDGSTKDRSRVVDRFQSDQSCRILLLSLKAAGTGLNLTAADHVFIMDPWWNPAVEEQAADRAHRIGQNKPVMIHRLVAKDTIEEKILILKEKKRSLADSLVAGGSASRLSRQELIALLSDSGA